MSNTDPICAHGIYLANCGICRSRMKLGLPLVRDCCHADPYQVPLLKPWYSYDDEKVECLLKAAEALIACSENIYAGSWRVPSDCLEKLKEVIIKAKEK